MQRWEYKFVYCEWNLEDKKRHPKAENGKAVSKDVAEMQVYEYCNQLGEEGWELVNLMVTERVLGSDTDLPGYRLVFKCPKE